MAGGVVHAPTWSDTNNDDDGVTGIMVNWGWGAQLGLTAQVGGGVCGAGIRSKYGYPYPYPCLNPRKTRRFTHTPAEHYSFSVLAHYIHIPPSRISSMQHAHVDAAAEQAGTPPKINM